MDKEQLKNEIIELIDRMQDDKLDEMLKILQDASRVNESTDLTF
jgi:hypothetical protein